jgi:hypothetical protein
MAANCLFSARRMLQEPEILGWRGGHPNIVQLRCAAVSQETLRIYIVMYLGLRQNHDGTPGNLVVTMFFVTILW